MRLLDSGIHRDDETGTNRAFPGESTNAFESDRSDTVKPGILAVSLPADCSAAG
jgi:hypothetical protein